MSVADPGNQDLFPNERFKASLVDVPGDQPSLYSVQDVPHGEMSYCFYQSKTLGRARPLIVYTPPGYREGKGKYPVFYLVSGTTDTEETWFKVGRVNFILDNLIAQKKAVPMVVVLPYGNMMMGTPPPTSIQAAPAWTQDNLQFIPHAKPRLIVLTDLSNEPDDEESLVRLLVYSDQFELEGLIATTATWLRHNPREDLIRRDLAAYAQVHPNLVKHSATFPPVEKLLAVTRTGLTNYGMAAVGQGKGTGGSQRIIEVVDRADDRPVWVSVWGGPNTLMQALWDVRASRSPAEVDKFVAKLQVYAISDQDDSGPWLRREFPNLFYIVTPSNPASSLEYYRATWTGISGGRGDQTAVGYHFDLVDNPWLEINVIKHHGPLGALYPRLQYIMEGDTPSFLGLIDRGLGWEISPAYGGWGGRYALYQPAGETRPIWTDNANTRDRVVVENDRAETSNQATLWRWREHFQNDFAARMDWCAADEFKKANHNPRSVLNGNRSTDVVMIPAKAGATVKLSAQGTDAGDEAQTVKINWWIYREAGTLAGATLTHTNGLDTEVVLSAARRAVSVHVILQAEDDGTPRLFAYRRVIIQVTP